MNLLMEILIIFTISSILGFLLEFTYLIIRLKKLTNPGFLYGPYLPIYGLGGSTIFLISLLNFPMILKGIIIILLITFLEGITGFIYIKLFKIRLWDYSHQYLNFRGFISIWNTGLLCLISILVLVLITPYFSNLISYILNHYFLFILILVIFGIMLLEMFYENIKYLKSRKRKKIINIFKLRNKL